MCWAAVVSVRHVKDPWESHKKNSKLFYKAQRFFYSLFFFLSTELYDSSATSHGALWITGASAYVSNSVASSRGDNLTRLWVRVIVWPARCTQCALIYCRSSHTIGIKPWWQRQPTSPRPAPYLVINGLRYAGENKLVHTIVVRKINEITMVCWFPVCGWCYGRDPSQVSSSTRPLLVPRSFLFSSSFLVFHFSPRFFLMHLSFIFS